MPDCEEIRDECNGFSSKSSFTLTLYTLDTFTYILSTLSRGVTHPLISVCKIFAVGLTPLLTSHHTSQRSLQSQPLWSVKKMLPPFSLVVRL